MGFKLVWEKGLTPPFLQRESRGRALGYPESLPLSRNGASQKKKQTNKHITELIQDSQCPYSHIEDPKPRITVSAVSPPQFYQGIVDKNYMYVRYATGFNICCDDYHSQVNTPITSQSYSCFCCEHRTVT